MPRRFQVVDVFSDQPFRGNPLGVVLDGEGLTTDEMQQITCWLNLSETSFLLPPTDAGADYRVRIFSTARELPFAGHPTLGSCHAWLHAGGKPRDPATIIQECGVGLIPIRQMKAVRAFAAPPLVRTGPVDESMLQEIAQFLGINRSDFVDAQWADNGPGWVVVLLATAQAVLDLEPARQHATRLDLGVVGPYAPGSASAYELRALSTDANGAVNEDPATGSLHASTAQWLLASGRVVAPYIASQGGRLGRNARVHISQDGGGQVWVGGHTATFVEGTLDS